MKYRNAVNRFGAAIRSTSGRVGAGVTTMTVSALAMAQAGGVGEAVTTEITAGKSTVSGILVVLAGVLGLFLLWSMIKRAK